MPNAQYVIDVAARMTGDETIGELGEISSGLAGAGKDAEYFQKAIQSLNRDLKSAQNASADANTALREGQNAYRELERGAVQAAKAAERAALKNNGVVPHELAAASARAALELEHQAHALAKVEATAAAAMLREQQLAQTSRNLASLNSAVNSTADKRAREQAALTREAERARAEQEKALTPLQKASKEALRNAESLEKLRSGLSVAGPVGRLGSSLLVPAQGFAKLSAEMGTSRAAMLLTATAASGLVVALVAVTAALAAATIGVAAWAVGLANSKRNLQLTSDATEALHPELVPLKSTIAAISEETGAYSNELQEMAGQLKEAKVSAKDMPAALRAMALAEAALGKGGSADFLAQLKAGKASARELANEFSTKLGPIVAKQMKGLDAQAATFKRNISDVFGGLNIEPALNGLARLVALFDANTASGAALKFMFEAFFQPLIDSADAASVVIEAFVLGFEIGLVKLYIAAKPAIKALKEMFGVKDTATTDTLSMAKIAGEAIAPVVVALTVAFAALAAVVAVGVVGAMILLAPLYIALAAAVAAVVAIVYAAVAAWRFFVNTAQSVLESLGGFGAFLSEIGVNLMKGFAAGILGGSTFIVDAITTATMGAIKQAKKLLGIASPSKLFAEIGVNTALGFAGGVEDAAPEAQGAVAEMVAPTTALERMPAAESAAAARSAVSGSSAVAPAGGGASRGVDLSGSTFNFVGVKDAEHAWDMFSERLTRLLEGDAAALGAPVEVG
jgi:hypothetical protein